MYKIVEKKKLNSSVTKMVIEAPFVAKKQNRVSLLYFVLMKRAKEFRFTIADFDRDAETVTIIFQIVGAETALLNEKNEGEYIEDFVGPLGKCNKNRGL